jgi:hypothetical protein
MDVRLLVGDANHETTAVGDYNDTHESDAPYRPRRLKPSHNSWDSMETMTAKSSLRLTGTIPTRQFKYLNVPAVVIITYVFNDVTADIYLVMVIRLMILVFLLSLNLTCSSMTAKYAVYCGGVVTLTVVVST